MSDAGVADVAPTRPALQRLFHSWKSLLEHLPVGVYVCDADGLIVHHNRRAVEIWGWSPSGDAGRYCGAWKAFDVEGAPVTLDRSAIAEVLATYASVTGRELIIEQPSGRRVHLLANAEPLLDDDGALLGAVGCIQDITELRQTRDRLRARQDWTRRVLESAPIAVYNTDAQGFVLSFNAAAAALWGREPRIGEDRWCGSFKLYSPLGVPMPLDQCPMAQAIRDDRQIQGAEAIFERPDGTRGAFLAYPTPLHGPEGELVGAINVLVDISERKRSEDLQKTLVDELNHRVKNTLATVQSLAVHSFHEAGDPRAMREAFEARLMALSGAHNRLAERAWEGAEFSDLAAGTLAPHGEARLSLSGPPVHLSARAAVTLAMVLHELAANAAKYGALSSAEGRLEVTWSRCADGLAVRWRECGGPPVLAPSRSGFGLRFIKGAVERELSGGVALDFAAEGLVCMIATPAQTLV
ncbi:sensor histidine kinase [Phenylobacterium sp.]|uniref:sensor histidine kinase n=1 Tax=Phenylobacterium sp. TaxID=1871053 RepID=UPI0027356440|nr:HWE histidine kinase domain-containing protein [Phenylobacterium sp.]MDP3854333.1 HWE histidine kinase domain-containing protein [Phenylobacterium sp.]